MKHDFNLKKLEKKFISRNNRFIILKKDLRELRKVFKNENVLIIGSAGSIGSEFVKDIFKLDLKPKKIFLLDKNENQLTELNREIVLLNKQKIKINYICSDITSFKLDNFLKIEEITIYLNFSAIKHVRSEENLDSVKYMFLTNALKFMPIKTFKLKKIFSISTDKSVKPASILGVSKKMMELQLGSFNKNKIFISSVRFANVSFSNGSILKHVIDQIYQKKIFGIPNNIRRYFITHAEASSLCFKSLLQRNNRFIVVPNPKVLKKDILIKSLVESMLRYFGYKPNFITKTVVRNNLVVNKKKFNVFLSSLNTDGQKDYEEFFDVSENIIPDVTDSSFSKIKFDKEKKNIILIIKKILLSKNINQIKSILTKNFPTYRPIKKFQNLSKII